MRSSSNRMDPSLAYLHLGLRVVLLLFPAIALWALRRAGPRALIWTTTAGAGAVVLFAFAAASERFGNRLAATHGYGPILLQILLVFSLTYLLPIAATAVTIRLLERNRLGGILTVVAGYAVLMLTWLLGILLHLAIRAG